MVILKSVKPEMLEFIEWKEREVKKAWALIDAGYEGAFNAHGGADDSVQFQNANHSVRVTDDFMRAYEKGGDWDTHPVTDRTKVMATFQAPDLMSNVAESAWVCGEPGVNGLQLNPAIDADRSSLAG